MSTAAGNSLLSIKSMLFIVIASSLATTISVIGQNSVLGAFVDSQIETLQITKIEFSVILTLATLLAAYLMRWATRLLVSWTLTRSILATTLAAACGLILWGFTLQSHSYLSYPLTMMLLMTALCMLRLFFRAVFKVLATSMITERLPSLLRSKAMAASGILAGILASALPFGTSLMLTSLQFTGTMYLTAAATLLTGCFISIMQRAAPLQRSQESRDSASSAASLQQPSTEMAAARKSVLFWIYALGIPLNSLIQSSASLFMLSIAEYNQVSTAYAYSLLIPAALAGMPALVLATLFMSHHKIIFLVHQLAILASSIGFLFLHHPAGWLTTALCFGVAAGLYTALSSNLWPTMYGSQHVKEFYGTSAAIDLAFSAIGPIVFSVLDHFYGIQVALCVFLPLPLINSGLILLKILLR